MLRRKSQSDNESAAESKGFIPYPEMGESFVLGHAPAGVHFYMAKDAFYFPYAALQTMRFGKDTLTIVFATDEVTIEGHGLHSLYVQLAEHRVKRIHEQGERYESVGEAPVFIRKIQRMPRTIPDPPIGT